MSFHEWNLSSMFEQSFIGIKNYKVVFKDNFFWTSFTNTIVYAIVTVPLQMLLGLIVAILIDGIKKMSVTFRILNYLPVITSWVIASLVFKYIFNTEGLLNYFISNILNIGNNNIHWLDNRWSGLWVIMFLGTWKGIGWNMVVFFAALQQVPKELYEASSLDGCKTIRTFFSITLPSIKPTILFAWVMLTIGAFNVYTSVKLMTNGAPAHKTETLLTWMYYKAFSTGEFGYSAALSFVMAFSLALIAVFQFKIISKKEN
ncbi:MAG: sugar ABC transporter permease [Sphaerochaetaceae bacterium]|nr:sugar ABC transporter permease [Sphaerochaetaceae bacterium]